MFKGKYNELVSHQTMIQDETRTQGYMEAIEKQLIQETLLLILAVAQEY